MSANHILMQLLQLQKSGGTDMEYRNFFVAPVNNGVSVLDANAATMDETLTWFCKDGVLYELIECDDLEIFADRGVQLGIVGQLRERNGCISNGQ